MDAPSTHLPNYQYQPLPSDKHIRLVHILAGSKDSAIMICFTITNLADAPRFGTLSYVWGAKRHMRITCQGTSLVIRENLHSALCNLRLTNENRTFWIDSLCINQEDLDERAQQVAMMRSLYASSHRTTIWLGETATLSDEAVALLKKLFELSKLNEPSGGLLDGDQSVWEELGNLYASIWFYRVWIIQEVVVAKSVVVWIKNELWEWDDFAATSLCAAVSCKMFQSVFDPIPACVLHRAREQYQSDGPYPTILSALERGKNAHASMDQDKVYGMIGLTNDTFEIDYKETTTETYLRLARAIISNGDASAMFNFVDDHAFRLDRGLPSWVPDWEVRHGPKPLDIPGSESSNWAASLDSQLSMQLSNDGRRLNVRGFIVDELDRVGDVFRDLSPVAGGIKRTPYSSNQRILQQAQRLGAQIWTIRRMKQWDGFKYKHARMYKEEDLESAFLHTLVGGCLSPGKESDDFLERTYKLWCKVWIAAASNDYAIAMRAYSQHDTQEMGEAALFYQMHVTAAWYRRFFITKMKRMMGLCPDLSRKKDLVVILHGVPTPLVLRRLKNGTFRIIGQLYVHGIMYGEAMSFEEHKNVQEFVIV